MEMTSSIKNSLFTAIVVGASTTAAYASAELGDAQVVQADANGFEATVSLTNQPIQEIGSIDLTRNAAAPNANKQASAQLIVSLDQATDGTDRNHLIRVKGPGAVSAENLAFNVQVSKLDGSKLIKSYEMLPGMAGTTTISAMVASQMSPQQNNAAAPAADVLVAMAGFEEIPGVTVLPTTESFSETAATAQAQPAAIPVITVKDQGKLASAAGALKIGEVTAHSVIGERLALEFDIAAQNVKNINDLSVQVIPDTSLGALAPDSVTAIAMMDQKIEKRGTDRYVVKLTSDQVMNEPLVPLLIDVKMGEQTESRSYSVFMEPARAALPTAAPETTFTANNGDFIMVDKPANAKARKRAAVAVAAVGVRSYGRNTNHYTVNEGETLATIAANIKGKVPLSEKMRYLRDSNPQAFVGGDMNQVIAGATLKFPSSWRTLNASAAAVAEPKNVAVLEDQASPVEVLAQSQTTESLQIPNVAPELDQLIGDEAPVAEVTAGQVAPVAPIAKTEQAPVVVTPVVEAGESLLDSTDALALGGAVGAVAMAAGGIVLLRRRKASAKDEFSLEEDVAGVKNNEFAEMDSLLSNDVISLDDVNYIAEAEALMARGQLDQALALIQTGVEEQPTNSTIVRKLFELLSLKADSVSFNTAAIAQAALLRQDKSLLAQVNQLAQKMEPVPELFQSMVQADNMDLHGQTV